MDTNMDEWAGIHFIKTNRRNNPPILLLPVMKFHRVIVDENKKNWTYLFKYLKLESREKRKRENSRWICTFLFLHAIIFLLLLERLD